MQKGFNDMHWSEVPFGKYKGKTFPEIIVRDPDWFFWVLPKLYGKLAEEAQELARRARAINHDGVEGA
jgi:broad specificity phosphatase PhoE